MGAAWEHGDSENLNLSLDNLGQNVILTIRRNKPKAKEKMYGAIHPASLQPLVADECCLADPGFNRAFIQSLLTRISVTETLSCFSCIR